MYKKDGNHHIVKAKGRLELIQAHQPTETLESIYNRLEKKPYALFNAGLFHLSNGKAASGLIINGEKIREKGIGGEVIYSKDGQVKHISLEDKWMGYINWSDWALESGPLLLPYFRDKGLDYNFVYGKHPRMALGYANGEFVVLATDPRPYGITTPELAHEMKALGCEWAMNLDGGSSVGLLINGKRVTASSRAVDTVFALYIEGGNELPKIIIDSGHGGRDPGGGTNQHWKEKDLTLKISLYQYERFKELGVPVALTRDDDTYLDWKARTDIVKASGADHCISNHINAGGGEGAEVIYSQFANSDLPRKIMDGLIKAGQKERRIFNRKGDNGKDYYYMHRETGRVITNIIEYGFADNENDTQRLLDHWKEYAEAVVKAYCEYLGYEYKTNDDKLSNFLNELQALIDKYKALP